MSLDASEDVVAPPGVADANLLPAIYEETQFFPAWVYAIVAGIGLISLAAVGSAVVNEVEPLQAAASGALIGVLGITAALNILVLRTRVLPGELHVSLGWVPFFWTHINLRELEEGRVVAYRPIWDAGGWGLRFGRFEGRTCRYWTARGNKGVFVAGGKRRLIVGSQQPEQLYRALESAGLGSGR